MKKTLSVLSILLPIVGITATADASPVGGERIASDVVGAYSTDRYEVLLRGKERWFLSVSGDGDTDLDCYVYDSNGNEIAEDSDSSDECRLTGTPRWTDTFKIHIVNRGGVYNRYRMRVF